MDLYHIYSVINYKYIDVTDERNALALDRQGRLDRPHDYLRVVAVFLLIVSIVFFILSAFLSYFPSFEKK
jgi:hypothetical protein